jgi:hypothetical protein
MVFLLPIVVAVYFVTLGVSYYRITTLKERNAAIQKKLTRMEFHERCRRTYLGNR